VKFAAGRRYSDPEKAARKILEIANSVKAAQDGRIHIENINAPFLHKERGSPAEYKAGLDLAIARGWRPRHFGRRRRRSPQASLRPRKNNLADFSPVESMASSLPTLSKARSAPTHSARPANSA
jgi:hypothetical protein